jgi:predicted RNase H-like nuclease (RuvC/YqgF family)
MNEEFTPITSQEALDAVLKDRLNRQREKHARELSEVTEKYKDYDAMKERVGKYEEQISALNSALEESNQKVAGYDSQIAERDAKISAYEVSILKSNIAATLGLAPELAERLTGSTEEELRADAEKLSAIVGKSHRVAPLASPTNTNVEDGVMAAFKKLNPDINF